MPKQPIIVFDVNETLLDLSLTYRPGGGSPPGSDWWVSSDGIGDGEDPRAVEVCSTRAANCRPDRVLDLPPAGEDTRCRIRFCGPRAMDPFATGCH